MSMYCLLSMGCWEDVEHFSWGTLGLLFVLQIITITCVFSWLGKQILWYCQWGEFLRHSSAFCGKKKMGGDFLDICRAETSP